MARTGRWLILVAAAASAIGCASTNRPYLRDPLVQNGRGVRGDLSNTSLEMPRDPEPTPPPRPALAGSLHVLD